MCTSTRHCTLKHSAIDSDIAGARTCENRADNNPQQQTQLPSLLIPSRPTRPEHAPGRAGPIRASTRPTALSPAGDLRCGVGGRSRVKVNRMCGWRQQTRQTR
eukprot:6954656-Prymnesium_polylepis.2